MNSVTYGIIAALFISYYYSDSLSEIYNNFGVYVPFFNVTTYLDLLRFVIVPRFTSSNSSERLFTVEDLKEFGGENANELYLAILGNVFDVSSAGSYYGSGQMYHGFTGILMFLLVHS